MADFPRSNSEGGRAVLFRAAIFGQADDLLFDV
jgi:hypothetical protein